MFKKNIDLTGKTILITGAAGFIGANLSIELLKQIEHIQIIGIDSLNDYYDVSLKEYRLAQINAIQRTTSGEFIFIKGNSRQISDFQGVYRVHTRGGCKSGGSGGSAV